MNSIAVISLIVFLGYLAIDLTIGINYTETLKTEYRNSTKSNQQIIETRWATFETPKYWKNFALHQTCSGYVGVLLTNKGLIDYEYGIMASSYLGDHEFETSVDTLNNLVFAVSKKSGETAIYIPPQKEMIGGLTFYSSETNTEVLEQLRLVIETLKFKK